MVRTHPASRADSGGCPLPADAETGGPGSTPGPVRNDVPARDSDRTPCPRPPPLAPGSAEKAPFSTPACVQPARPAPAPAPPLTPEPTGPATHRPPGAGKTQGDAGRTLPGPRAARLLRRLSASRNLPASARGGDHQGSFGVRAADPLLPSPAPVKLYQRRSAATSAQSRDSRPRPGWSGSGRTADELGGEHEGWRELRERPGRRRERGRWLRGEGGGDIRK